MLAFMVALRTKNTLVQRKYIPAYKLFLSSSEIMMQIASVRLWRRLRCADDDTEPKSVEMLPFFSYPLKF